MDVVRCLRCAPQSQLIVGIVISDRRMLLHRQVCVAFVEESIFANQIGFSEPFVHLAEFQRDFLVNVTAIPVLVNARLINHHSFFNRRDCLERLVLDFNQIHRVKSDIFIDCCDRGDRIADEAHLVDAERMFILADRKNAVGNRQVFTGDNGQDTWQGQRFRYIDIFNQRMRQMTAQDLAVEHAWEKDIVRKFRLPGALRARVDLAKWLADYIERLSVVVARGFHENKPQINADRRGSEIRWKN